MIRLVLLIIAIILFLAVAMLDFQWFGVHADDPHLFGLTGLGLASVAGAMIFGPPPP